MDAAHALTLAKQQIDLTNINGRYVASISILLENLSYNPGEATKWTQLTDFPWTLNGGAGNIDEALRAVDSGKE
jgi:hypothetical protein